MRLNRFACLLLFATVLANFFVSVPQCGAQSEDRSEAVVKRHVRIVSKKPYRPYTGIQKPSTIEPDAGVSSDSFYESETHTASPMIPAPILQGATGGAIGPPSSPVALPGVCIEPTQIATKRSESPVIPTLLFASLALSLIFVGVRSLVFKKRAPLFVLGLIAAGALMLVGFMLSFYEPVTLASAPPVQPVAISQPESMELSSEAMKQINIVKPEYGTAAAAIAIPD